MSIFYCNAKQWLASGFIEKIFVFWPTSENKANNVEYELDVGYYFMFSAGERDNSLLFI